jgi:hypothetical protein
MYIVQYYVRVVPGTVGSVAVANRGRADKKFTLCVNNKLNQNVTVF